MSTKTVVVDYFGEEKKAINEFYDIHTGDYIYAQGGFVIKKIPSQQAESILSAWEELFYKLQGVDRVLSRLGNDKKSGEERLRSIFNNLLRGIPLRREEAAYLINLSGPQVCALFFRMANSLRRQYHNNSCCVHGIIEISNYCKQNCLYCGLSRHNKKISRYRMLAQEIIDVACKAVEKYGFQALVLQSGEDPFYTVDKLADIIKKIKEKTAVLICISFGEVGIEGLKKLYKAGARAMLMRFETSNSSVYEELRPGLNLHRRLEHLREAKDLGYLIITGGLIGLPGQTKEDIVNDIYLAKELAAEMYSFGPFLPHPDTPLAGTPTCVDTDVLKTLALSRFLDPENAKILVTTAFETLYPQARKKGLLCGASSLMLNITPSKYRKLYAIYPNRAYEDEPLASQIKETLFLLRSLGRAPTDLGVS